MIGGISTALVDGIVAPYNTQICSCMESIYHAMRHEIASGRIHIF